MFPQRRIITRSQTKRSGSGFGYATPSKKLCRTATTVDQLPNEILQKIIGLLPFQDMMQCSNTCKRFFLNSRRFYPEAWTINTQLTSERIFHISPAPNSLLVSYADGLVELLEFTSCNRNLFKTGLSDGNERIDKNIILGRHLPNTRNVVCFSETVFYVFDMEKVEKIAEVDVGKRIFSLRCSSEAVAVVVMVDNWKDRLLLYSWDGGRTELIRVFEEARIPQISANGVFAMTRTDRIELFNAHSRTELGRIRMELRGHDDNHNLHLNVDGTMLAVKSGERLYFFDTTTKEPLSELTLPRTSPVQFSDDFRVFYQLAMANEIHLTTLDFDEERKISIAYTRRIPARYNVFTVQLRRINGIHHVQFVTYENVLKLYRLDDNEKQWHPVD